MRETKLPVELPHSIAEALDRGVTIITANQRAARTLRYGFDKRNRQLKLPSWKPAAVLSWDAWTRNLWNGLLVEGLASNLLLNNTQEHLIWRRIVSTDPELQNTLRSPDSLAQLAVHAWQLLTQHHAQHRLRSAWSNSETLTFQRWATSFEKLCKTEGLLPAGTLESVLRDAIETGRLHIPTEIGLVGFDEMTPAQFSLIDAVKMANTRVETISTAQMPTRRSLVIVDNDYEELAAAARWARTLLQKRPQLKIGIIASSLEDRRSSIDRVFREVLAPELEDIEAPRDSVPYEFSLGSKLSGTPMVRVARDLLRWARGPIPITNISALLVSPLFALVDSERNARAMFDAFELRKAKLLRPEASIDRVADMITRSKRRSQLPHVANVLRKMNRSAQNLIGPDKRLRYGKWPDIIREFLETAEWGRARGEDSLEFQLRRKWEGALDELATLDFDAARVDFSEALSTLEYLVQSTMFAPESRQAPIQIMGPLEAAGSSFDALWFLGAGDLSWPMKTSINPLLPWKLQRELKIPGTDSGMDDIRARHRVQRIAESAPTTIFSCAAESSQGKQRPSPVLDVLQLESVPVEEVAPLEERRRIVQLEEFTDDTPVSPTPDRVIPGGADILRLQAACGFRAFAERRLWSTELREITLGMDASERGNIVHQTLEYFWNEVKSQAQLKAMNSDERKDVLDRAIDYGLRRAGPDAKGWDAAYVDVQRARLRNLLVSWLELELNRDPFSVKLSEKNFDDVRIGPLRLSVRVDRVDITNNGDIIIDYKTGNTKPSEWQSSRPDAPQLPLYAVLAATTQSRTKLADLAFAQIRAGKDMALDGFATKVTNERTRSKNPRVTLDEQLDAWHYVLRNLAEAFHRGDAKVDPKNYPSTCSYCAQRILCRLDPAKFDEELDDEETSDSRNGESV